MPFTSPTNYRWFHRWWGVVLVGLAIFVVIAVLVVGGFTGYYWWQIRHGKGVVLQKQFADSFTTSIQGSSVQNSVDRAVLESTSSPYFGRADAPLVIVEFVDFKCPNCLRAAPILQRVVSAYGAKIKLIMRNFPADSIPGHAGATELAALAQCAHEQGRFQKLHDVLFANQNNLPVPLTAADSAVLADQAGLDKAALDICLKSPSTLQAVRADYFAGINAGVRGTPTFFINGYKVEGVIPWEAWKNYLESVTF